MCLGLPPRDYCCLSVLICGAGGLTPGSSRAPLCASAFGAAQWEGDRTPVFPSHLMKGATRCPGLAHSPALLRAPRAGLWPWLERIPSFRRLGSAELAPQRLVSSSRLWELGLREAARVHGPWGPPSGQAELSGSRQPRPCPANYRPPSPTPSRPHQLSSGETEALGKALAPRWVWKNSQTTASGQNAESG